MPDNHQIVPVIMSGGAGTRLWPASTAATPKQLLPLIGPETMIQQTAMRLSGHVSGAEFLPPVIVCNAAHGQIIKNQLAQICISNPVIITEPCPRNTAPCAALAAQAVNEIYPGAHMLLAPADHYIRKTDAFQNVISAALSASSANYLVTFGITADKPETGYGYIQAGDGLTGAVRKVAAFKEKQDADTAAQYLRQGGYSWNAGIFLAKPQALLAEMTTQSPDIKFACDRVWERTCNAGALNARWFDLDPDSFAACPSLSIDYAVMEKTERAAVIEADIGWSDIGSWSALWEMDKGANNNTLKGPGLMIDTANSLVQTDGPFVAALGLDGMAVIVQGGKILVTPLDKVQDVKKIVEALKSGNQSNLL